MLKKLFFLAIAVGLGHSVVAQDCSMSNVTIAYGGLDTALMNELSGGGTIDSTLEFKQVIADIDISNYDYLGKIQIELTETSSSHPMVRMIKSKSELDSLGWVVGGHLHAILPSMPTNQTYRFTVVVENYTGISSPIIQLDL